ncbi:MAG: beta-carotene 15,15'-monooxygenase [Corynebacterium sp.]|nr:beta-carotene 15,15'-monooxygenase [Corynebacterium sp.]MDO5031957.1 beta-carotene 15,15'-monooxygenase [Corynebacterium sp.]
MRARGRWFRIAGAVVGLWILCGMGIYVAGVLGAPVVWWDLIHPLTIGALTTAIVVLGTHFSQALTRTPAGGYRGVAARVALVQAALVLLLVDRAGYDWGVASTAASLLVIVALGWQFAVIYRCLRGALTGSFAVTVPWYLAACVAMVISALLVLAAGNGLGNYSALVAAHSRGMVWGFALMTIVATVVTLLPTLTGTRIAGQAAARCLRALVVHCVGLSAAMFLYAVGLSVAAGMAQLFVVLAVLSVIQPVLAGVLRGRMSIAALAVIAGLVWMLAVCAADAALALVGEYPRGATLLLMPVFVGAALLQMVTGVAQHLLPVLLGGGPDTVRARQQAAQRGGYLRLALINAGGVACLFGAENAGLIMMGLGLGATVVLILLALGKHPSSTTEEKGEAHA